MVSLQCLPHLVLATSASCCFSKEPDGACDVVSLRHDNGTCPYPHEYARDSWFVRVLDVPAPSLEMGRGGNVTLYSEALKKSLQNLGMCSNTLTAPSVSQISVDAAIAGFFFFGMSLGLLLTLCFHAIRKRLPRRLRYGTLRGEDLPTSSSTANL